MSSQHECVDCQSLPVDDRPNRPRPATRGGPRSRRCETHWRTHIKAQRLRKAVKKVSRLYGIPEEEQAELWAFQGEKCPCGRQPRLRPDTDHDHACCSGPTSCGKCVRGMTCRACNREVLGRYNADQLRALAEYLENPPAQRLRQLRESGAA